MIFNYYDKFRAKDKHNKAPIKNTTSLYNLTYTAPIFDYTGYGEAARGYLRAFDSIDSYSLKPFSYSSNHKWFSHPEILDYIIKEDLDYVSDKVNVIHSNPRQFKNYSSLKGKNIGLTVWETDSLKKKWVSLCNEMDEIWVPCDYNKEVFESSGIVAPIHVVPHVAIKRKSVPFFASTLDTKPVTFYSIFTWDNRKNPSLMLSAFFQEFNEKDNVHFIIKTSGINQEDLDYQILELKQAYKKNLNITAISEKIPNEAIQGLHEYADIFVLLSHSEGWGLPHFEAALVGNPVVTSRYCGLNMFLNDSNSYHVEYELGPVKWNFEWYSDTMKWAYPKLESAKEQMRKAYEDCLKGNTRQNKEELFTKFSPSAIGQIIKSRI